MKFLGMAAYWMRVNQFGDKRTRAWTLAVIKHARENMLVQHDDNVSE